MNSMFSLVSKNLILTLKKCLIKLTNVKFFAKSDNEVNNSKLYKSDSENRSVFVIKHLKYACYLVCHNGDGVFAVNGEHADE